MSVCSLLHQQREGGGRKDVRHAFMADAGGKCYSSSGARGDKGREGAGAERKMKNTTRVPVARPPEGN